MRGRIYEVRLTIDDLRGTTDVVQSKEVRLTRFDLSLFKTSHRSL